MLLSDLLWDSKITAIAFLKLQMRGQTSYSSFFFAATTAASPQPASVYSTVCVLNGALGRLLANQPSVRVDFNIFAHWAEAITLKHHTMRYGVLWYAAKHYCWLSSTQSILSLFVQRTCSTFHAAQLAEVRQLIYMCSFSVNTNRRCRCCCYFYYSLSRNGVYTYRWVSLAPPTFTLLIGVL